MPRKSQFQCKWPEEANYPNGLFYPDDIEDRTPHPEAVPQVVRDIVASTYASTTAASENEHAGFSLFPKLPTELRQMIWRYSLPGPRVIEIYYSESGVCFSPCPIPTALHINREARGVALEEYEACFATSTAPAQIYFDMKVDILYFGVGNFSPSGADPVAYLFGRLLQKDLCRIKNIAIDSEIDTIYPDDEEEQPGLLSFGLVSLECVTCIQHDEGNEQDFDMVLQKSEDESGEFHAWRVNDKGIVSPWHLSQEATPWESDVSASWGMLEENAFDESPSIKTFRLVSLTTLMRESCWKKRYNDRRQFLFCYENGCLYENDGLAKQVFDLYRNGNISRYDQFMDILNVGVEGPEILDPMDIYHRKTPCSCFIGHRQILVETSEGYPDISTVDLGAIFAILNGGQPA